MPSDPSHASSAETDPAGSSLSRLFRSKSDPNVKRSSYKLMTPLSAMSEMDIRRSSDRRLSNSSSSSNSSARRYRRVLRDVAPSGDGFLDENPNVVHKFSKEYLENHNIDKISTDQYGSGKDLPYEVTGSTILKKPFGSSESGVRISANKPTISFGNEVEVIEYDKQEKVKVKSSCMLRRVQLSMDEDTKCIVDDPEKENSRRETSPCYEDVLTRWD